jgi:hypothetical protein
VFESRDSSLQHSPCRQEPQSGFLHDIRPAGGSEPSSIELCFPGKEGACFHKAVKLDGPVSQPLGVVVLWPVCFVHVCFDVQVGWRSAISLRNMRMSPEGLSKTSCKGASKSLYYYFLLSLKNLCRAQPLCLQASSLITSEFSHRLCHRLIPQSFIGTTARFQPSCSRVIVA